MFTKPILQSEDTLKPWERLPLVEMQKTEKEGVIARTMAPFTRCLRDPSTRQLLSYLSCISYFEVEIQQNLGYSAMDDFKRFSIGIACSLFPLRKKQLGFDPHSFGYHRDGSLVHCGRKLAQMTAYSTGDIIGCGLIYPPLTNSPVGKIFFTKNGGLVGIFDLGVESLFSLPWFPAMGLAPSIPMEFKFGFYEPYLFDILDFERKYIEQMYRGCGWEYYQCIAAEQEMNLIPNVYVRHPLYTNYYFTEYRALYENANGGGVQQVRRRHRYRLSCPGIGNESGVQNVTSGGAGGRAETEHGIHSQLSPTNDSAYDSTVAQNAILVDGLDGCTKSQRKCLPNLHHSLYLDNDIRIATFLGLNDTKRVTFQGSDASWENSAGGDGSDEDEESESDSNYIRNNKGIYRPDEEGFKSELGSDHVQIDSTRSAIKRKVSDVGHLNSRHSGGEHEPLVGVLRHSTTATTSTSTSTSNRNTFSTANVKQRAYSPDLIPNFEQHDPCKRMETLEIFSNDQSFSDKEHTGLRRGSGAIARKVQAKIHSLHGHMRGVKSNTMRLDYLADGSGSVTSEGTDVYSENLAFLEANPSAYAHNFSTGHKVASSYASEGSENGSESCEPHNFRHSRGYTDLRNHKQILALEARYGLQSSKEILDQRAKEV